MVTRVDVLVPEAVFDGLKNEVLSFWFCGDEVRFIKHKSPIDGYEWVSFESDQQFDCEVFGRCIIPRVIVGKNYQFCLIRHVFETPMIMISEVV